MTKEYDPDKRPRLTEEQAREALRTGKVSKSETPVHLILNEDGTYSFYVHSTPEWFAAHLPCKYCRTQGDARGKSDIEAVPYVPDATEVEYYRKLLEEAIEREKANGNL